ncbi:MAG: sulfurtransferase-like selenium metabolism protein YedF [Desulfobacteraceae bacterium]|nr:MAG: sulfurtransferase-like selenium metabolism protein YedF [Desulfobacteraceae bacterium]
MKIIDARKLACPAPVLAAKQAIENDNPSEMEILVDNDAARQNVTRFLESRSYQSSVTPEGPDFRITGTRGHNTSSKPLSDKTSNSGTQKIMIMVATDRIGYGDDILGQKLMISFIKTLKEMGPELWRLVFVNNGVKLTVSGADTLPDLQDIAQAGVTIMVCGTCLTYFNLLDAKQVGETTNMLDIVTAMQLADKVINL